MAASIVGVGALVALTPAAAQAYPVNCTTRLYQPNGGALAECTAGTGRFRVIASCQDNYYKYVISKFYGAWSYPYPGAYSRYYCPTGTTVIKADVDLSNS
ncbi:hypothetical protein [Actinoplanes aureus]|uniref:Secreted protein n=1 Tax=Actinoplanes aureus TaxID=2792083 RepID=A0A931CE99_9ACTN|nr:hypothetical protein [Actinoplanes aureus]MBG0565882.1 hypothetical protein [Actinoplanes aureus]